MQEKAANHQSIAIGFDLGGTKIEVVALAEGGDEQYRLRVPTPQGDYEATLDAVAGLVSDAQRKVGKATTIGVGTPGAVSMTSGLVKNSNSVCLNGRPLKADLEARLGSGVLIENDANCFALSEAVDGAGAGASLVFGVILGTGVGGGLVIDGRIVTGANAIAGEWGHNRLPTEAPEELPGPACYCGRRGCIETYLSGPGLVRDYREALVQDPRAAASLQNETALFEHSATAIAAAAAQGDPVCEAALGRYERRLAWALAQVINIVDPDVIVLGGGLSQIDRLYRNVPRLWGAHVFSDTIATRLERNRHGDSSGVRGAAWLGRDRTGRYLAA
jgi:fructokinase